MPKYLEQIEELEEEEQYYIEAIGKVSTRVGRHFVEPGAAPIQLGAREFKRLSKVIEHYRRAGIIMVMRPGTKESAIAAAKVRAEIQRASQITAGGAGPPASIAVNLQQQLLPEDATKNIAGEQMATFSHPEDTSSTPVETEDKATASEDSGDDLRCIAITGKGTRCKNSAMPDKVVCSSHFKSLQNSKIILDGAGNRIDFDGEWANSP